MLKLQGIIDEIKINETVLTQRKKNRGSQRTHG